jgi:hypothetical protein
MISVLPFSLASRIISTISCVVIFALTEGISSGEEMSFSGRNAKYARLYAESKLFLLIQPAPTPHKDKVKKISR